MHWLKTLIFTHWRFIKAVASDQHNYANDIKMIKGVHQLTIISLIDQFTIFNGWIDSQADPGADPGLFVRGEGGPGPTARIQDPHMGPIHMYVRTHTYIGLHTYIHRPTYVHKIHTYACTDVHMRPNYFIFIGCLKTGSMEGV